MVQDWSPSASYTLPANTAPGRYNVIAWIRTSSAVAIDASSAPMGFQVVAVAATGVSVTASTTSPNVAPVEFTAHGTGGSAASYQFRFYLDSGAGYAIVQDWSPSATYTLPANTAPGRYNVIAWIRTSSAVAIDASSAPMGFQVVDEAATGVRFGAVPDAPAKAPITFSAEGTGGVPGSYEYKFWVDAGTGYAVAQDWSSASSWTLDATNLPGVYRVIVWVRTSALVVLDYSSSPITYVVIP
jgi:hypothetical protein